MRRMQEKAWIVIDREQHTVTLYDDHGETRTVLTGAEAQAKAAEYGIELTTRN